MVRRFFAFRKVACLASLTFAFACASEPHDLSNEDSDAGLDVVEQAIIDGQSVSADEATAMVKLDGPDNYICSASFLRPGLVITATHCWRQNLTVRTGVTGFRSDRVPTVLDRRQVGSTDITLIKVSTDFNPPVDQALLSTCDGIVGRPITMYGRISETKYSAATQANGFERVTDAVAWVGSHSDSTYSYTRLAIGYKLSGGDSGGPAYVDGKLAGVNAASDSFGGKMIGGNAYLASICHHRSELVSAAEQLGFDLNTAYNVEAFKSGIRDTCATSMGGSSLTEYKRCLADRAIPYARSDAPWVTAVKTYCNSAVVTGGFANYDAFKQCLAERDVDFNADDPWWINGVETHCVNSQAGAGAGYGNYDGYKKCLDQRGVAFNPWQQWWYDGVKSYCLGAQAGGGYANFRGYQTCLDQRTVLFVADDAWCAGVKKYCEAQWYPFGGKDKCYSERDCRM